MRDNEPVFNVLFVSTVSIPFESSPKLLVQRHSGTLTSGTSVECQWSMFVCCLTFLGLRHPSFNGTD
jgi:hypothetical protein